MRRDLAPTTGVGGAPIHGALTRTDPQSRRRHRRAHPLSQCADATRRGATGARTRSHNAPMPHVGAPPSAAAARAQGHATPKTAAPAHLTPTPEIGRSPHPTSEALDLAAGRHIGDRSAPLPAIGRLIGRKSGPDSTRRHFIGLRRALSDVKLAQVSCNSQKAPTPSQNAHRDL